MVENNALSDGFQLPKGMKDYGQAVTSWNQYAVKPKPNVFSWFPERP